MSTCNLKKGVCTETLHFLCCLFNVLFNSCVLITDKAAWSDDYLITPHPPTPKKHSPLAPTPTVISQLSPPYLTTATQLPTRLALHLLPDRDKVVVSHTCHHGVVWSQCHHVYNHLKQHSGSFMTLNNNKVLWHSHTSSSPATTPAMAHLWHCINNNVLWRTQKFDDHLYSAIVRSLEQTHCAHLWFYRSSPPPPPPPQTSSQQCSLVSTTLFMTS